MVLLIDNYDSFVYNLYQYLLQLGQQVLVKRNDEISIKQVEALQPNYIVISPGPCTPDDAGICIELVQTLADKFPILGVCLGHQCIAQAFGGKVTHASKVMHGKTSTIKHNRQGLFKTNIPIAFTATRYHSLIVSVNGLPQDLEITAWTENQAGVLEEIMGLKHKTLPIEGVQFHPESILTEHGHQILKNFLDLYSNPQSENI